MNNNNNNNKSNNKSDEAFGTISEEPVNRSMQVSGYVHDTFARVIRNPSAEYIKQSPTPGHVKVPPPQNETGWKIDQLLNVPNLWRLDQTAVFVPNVSAQVVADRIVDCLRKLSVAAEYFSDPVKARCYTMSRVDFRIRLFKGKGSYDHGVIVEVQKRDGCSINFCKIRRAILREAEGEESKLTAEEANRFWDCANLLPLEEVEPMSEEEVLKAVQDGVSLVNEQRLDSNIIGLESLCFMTDPVKCVPEVCSATAIFILSADDGYCVRDMMQQLFGSLQLPYDKHGDYNNDHRLPELRFLCYKLISNTLGYIASENTKYECGTACDWLENVALPYMLDALKAAHIRPHEAFYATKSILCMQKVFQRCDEKARELEAAKHLKAAHHVGNSSHAYLANATKTALEAFS